MDREPAEELRGAAWILALAFAAGVLLALFGRRMPAPLAADAAPGLFSAARARAHLDAIARVPRPVGSEEHAAARRYLLGALRALELEPEEQVGSVLDAPLTNLLAFIPGSAASGAVLLLAHYDSVPGGPGAGDDGAGVASWLEALRALQARGWQPRNDVILLLSDGEELGLLGAYLFSSEHPAAADVRAVVNLEAIGNGGPALLFQTSPQNGALVRAFAHAVPAPCATSLGDAVYARMPNDTDLSVLLERGVSGFNLALTAGSAAYHAPHDLPENLDPRSLQHMGECALALAEHLGELDLTRLGAPDATFFDLLGYGLVRYPRAWDAGFVALGVLLVAAAVVRARPRARTLLAEFLVHPLECALAASVIFAVWFACDRAARLLVPGETWWVRGNTTTGTLTLLGLACLVVLFLARRSARVPERRVERTLAALLWLALAALVALAVAPGASHVFHVTVLLAAPGALVACARTRRDARASPARDSAAVIAVQALFLALACLFGLPILHLLLQLFQRAPERAFFLVAALLAFAAVPFLPALAPLARRGPSRALLATGACSLLLSILVARVLDWRQGSFWP